MAYNKTSNKILSFILCLCLMFTNFANIIPNSVKAEPISQTKHSFEIVDTENAKVQLNSIDTSLKVYTAEDLSEELGGETICNGNVITFTPSQEPDKTKNYFYVLTIKDYKEKKSTFKFDVENTNVSVEKEAVIPETKDTGTYKFKIKGTNKYLDSGEISFLDGSNKPLSIKYEEGSFVFVELNTSIKYTVDVKGYKPYNGTITPIKNETAEEIEVDLIKKSIYNFEINEDKTNVDFHPSDESVKNLSLYDLLKNINTIRSNISFELISGSDVISIDNNKYSIIGYGEAKIKAKLSETDEYLESETTITINVNKIDLGKIDDTMVDWSDKDKVKEYDKTDVFQLNGTIKKPSKVIANTPITITAEVKVGNSNAGEYSGKKLENVKITGLDGYDYDASSLTAPTLKINKKKVNLAFKPEYKDIKITYGSNEWESLNKKTYSLDPDTFLNKEEIDESLKENVNLITSMDNTYVGTHKDVISIDTSKTNLKNYEIIDASDKANITIEEEKAEDSMLNNLVVENAGDFYHKPYTLYVNKENVLNLKLKDTSKYDQVEIKLDGSDKYTINTIDPSTTSENGNIGASIVFSNSKNKNTKTSPLKVNNLKLYIDGKLLKYNIYIDDTKPQIEFKEAGLSIWDWAKDLFEFGLFYNKEKYININVSEDKLDSGIESKEYQIVNIKPTDDIKKLIEDSKNNNNWKTINGSRIRIPKDNAYLLILVKATDRTGNTSIKASNGIIMDSIKPNLKIPNVDAKKYNKELKYTIKVDDGNPNDIQSFIKEIEVKVNVDGKEVSKDKITPFNIGPTTLENIQKLLQKSTFIKTGIVKDEGNHIVIEATAYDFAGNVTSVVKTKGFTIDKTKPVIEVPIDKTDSKYYNTERKVDISITDANFNSSTTYINLKVNGEKQTLNFDDIEKNKYKDNLGIVFEKKEEIKSELINKEFKYSLTFGYGNNTEYSYENIKINSTDDAGNKADTNTNIKDFVVDKVAPKLNIKFEQNGNPVNIGTDKNNIYATNANLVATLVTEESNYDIKSVKFSSGEIDTTKANSNKNNHEVKTKEITKDGKYEVYFECTDKAGNKAKSDTYYFIIDKEAPNGTININGQEIESIKDLSTIQKIFYGIFSNYRIEIKNSVEDNLSGIKSVEYAIIENNKKKENTAAKIDDINEDAYINSLSKSDIDNLTWTKWKENDTKLIDIRKGDSSSAAIVYLKITDNAGNTTIILGSKAYILENTSPEKDSIKIEELGKIKDKYNSDISLKVSASDNPDSKGIYSGIKSIKWSIDDNKNKNTQTGEYSVLEPRQKEASTKVIIDSKKNNSNNVKLNLLVSDYSGNITEVSKTYKIDTTKPSIEIKQNNVGSKNDKYYNKTKDVSVVFNERNFDPNKATLELEINKIIKKYTFEELVKGKAKDKGINASLISDSEKDVEEEQRTDNRKIEYKISFGYTDATIKELNTEYAYEDIKINVTDEAENKADEKTINNITVDNVTPKISVKYEQNGKDITKFISKDSNNPFFTTGEIDVKISVEEENFKKEDFIINLTQTDSKKNVLEVYKLNTKNWDKNNKVNTIKLDKFKGEANYSLNVKYTDLAGNKSEEYKTDFFTIDRTAPLGKIMLSTKEGDVKAPYSVILNDKEVNKDKHNQTFNVFSNQGIYLDKEDDDLISGVKSVEYARVKAPTNAKKSFTSTANVKKLNYKPWSKEIVLDKDTIETIYLKITDKAGNIAYISSSGAYIQDTKSPDAPIIKIDNEGIEKHNSDIKVKLLSLDPENGKGIYSGMKTLEYEIINHEAEDKITQSGMGDKAFKNKESRNQNLNGSLVINSDLNNSNNVELKVIATDYAGNKTEQSAFFKIDKTKPVITASLNKTNVQNQKYYNTARKVEIKVKERNFDPNKAIVSLKANGNKKSYTLEEIDKGKAKDIAIELEKIEDSEKEKEDKNRTDERTITYNLLFGNGSNIDFAYTDIRINAVDEAGNKANEEKIEDFTVDNIAPTIKVEYKAEENVDSLVTTSKEAPYYTNKDMTVTVNIEENNFANAGVEAILEQTNLEGVKVSAYNNINDLSSGVWNRKDNVNTYVMSTFSGDARYALSLNYTDLAGNKAQTYESHYFVVDKTAPQGEITIVSDDGTKSSDKLLDTLTYDFITSKNVEVSQKSSDATSGIKSTGFYLYRPNDNEKGSIHSMSLEELRRVDWEEWTDTKLLSPNMHGVLYLRLIDRAGNISYISASGAIILDSQEPDRPNIVINTHESGENFYNGNIKATISVSDKENGGTYAGLKTVKIEVLNNNNVTQTETYEVGSKGSRIKDFTKDIEIESTKNNTNFVKVRVTTTDWANNMSSGEKEIKIDTTKPKIEVVYDLNNPSNGKYYNKTRTATVKVYERNFNPKTATIRVNGGQAQVGAWSIGDKQGKSDDNLNTALIRFNQDGDYTFKVDVTDMAGNNAKYDENNTFTIDQTKPLINVSFDKDLMGGKYIASSRTATITIKEHNFNAKDFNASVKAIYNGKGIATPNIGPWTGNGDIHTSRITFAKDGTYSFFLNYVDLAGNSAEQYSVNEFILDMTKAEITFEGIKDKSANRGNIDLRVKIQDENFDPNGVRVSLRGLNHEERIIYVSQNMSSQLKNGAVIRIPDIEHKNENDDIYTLNVRVKDRAGNVEEKSMSFSVNRFGSNYDFDEKTREFLNNYYTKEAEDIIIYEINPDELTNQTISIIKDGVARELDKNEYTINDVSKYGEFKKYKYVLPKSLFNGEGQYEIVINSEDVAGNKQNNKIKKSQASFAIDKTNPGAVITGIENKQVYDNETREITISVEDNMIVDKAELYINDALVKTYEYEEIQGLLGKLPYKLDGQDIWQKIKAVVYDAAGNKTETEEVNVLISSNPYTRFIYGKGLKLVLTGLGVLLGVFILVMLLKRRRDENKSNESDNKKDNSKNKNKKWKKKK